MNYSGRSSSAAATGLVKVRLPERCEGGSRRSYSSSIRRQSESSVKDSTASSRISIRLGDAKDLSGCERDGWQAASAWTQAGDRSLDRFYKPMIARRARSVPPRLTGSNSTSVSMQSRPQTTSGKSHIDSPWSCPHFKLVRSVLYVIRIHK